MKKPKLREIKEALVSLISRPYTTRFPLEPHIPARGFRGQPQFDPEQCVGCGACANVCPSKAIDVQDVVQDGRGLRRLTHYASRCIFCGQCEANCIVEPKGIRLTDRFHLAYFEEKESTHSVQQELVVCERCGAVIGTVRHLLWTARKLGQLAFSHPVLIEFLQQSLEMKIEVRSALKDKPVNRIDIFRIICPRCRHEALLSDEKIPT